MAGFLGALPASAFRARVPTEESPWVIDERGALETPEPFIWGEAGHRMTPEDIALQRRLAAQQMQGGADYSPVQHWAQGLARMSQGIIGGLQMKDARKASEANVAEGDAITRALLSGGEGSGDPVLAALLNPNTPEQTRDLAMMQYKQANRPPPQPGEFERALTDSGVAPGTPEWQAAMVRRRDNMLDPLASVPLPGGQVYLGPRSGLSAVLGGGDPASTAPGGASPPATLPPDFDGFDKGGPASKAPGGFR